MTRAPPVRWGVIGAGGIARRRTIPEGILQDPASVLAAVCDPACGDDVARQFGVACCADAAALVARGDVDAVYIATPVHLHVEQGLLAAGAGKHVLCEKPLALDVPSAERLVEGCARAGVALGTAFMMRFHPLHVAAAEAVRGGQIGTPVYGRAQLSCWYPPIAGAWRQDSSLGGGGALVDLGAHCIDLLEQFFGLTRRVACTAARRVHHEYPVEDTAVVLLEFASGARGTVDCLFNMPDEASENRLEVYGSGGSLLAEGTIGQSFGGTLRMLSTSGGAYDAAQNRAAGATRWRKIPPAFSDNPYLGEIRGFTAALCAGRPPPVDGNAGLHVQRVLSACYRSVESGRFERV